MVSCAQPHRQGVDRPEPDPDRLLGEGGPSGPVGGQVGDEYRRAVAVAVQARAFVVLDLHQLQQTGPLAGGGHHPQPAADIDQHQPRRGDLEQLDARIGEIV